METRANNSPVVEGLHPRTTRRLPRLRGRGERHSLSQHCQRQLAGEDQLPLWITLAVMLALVTVLSWTAAGPNTLAGDLTVGRAIQQLDNAFFDTVASIGNFLGEGSIVFTAAVALLLGALFLRRWRDVLFLSLLIIFRLSSLVLKEIIASPRPAADDLRLDGQFEDYGFPSGHATSAMVLAGAVAVLLLRRVHHPGARLAGLAICALVALTTGFARVYVGAHWPTDVLGGYLWGAIIVLLALLFSRLVGQAGTPNNRTP